MRHLSIATTLMILLGACAVEGPPDRDPAADEAAGEEVVGDFFRAMEGWDYERLRGTVTASFEVVEDTVILSMDEFVSFIEPFEAQGGQMRWTFTDFNTESDGDVAGLRPVHGCDSG